MDGKPDMEDWLRENYEALRKVEPELPDYETFCELGGYQYKEQICHIAFEKQIAYRNKGVFYEEEIGVPRRSSHDDDHARRLSYGRI